MVFEIIFGVALLLFAGMSVVLEHHWRSHAENSQMLFIVRLFYYGGSGVFFLLTLAALLNTL